MSDPTLLRTPEQIQAELDATRLQMSATVDQLVHTLTPAHQMQVAKDTMRAKFDEAKVCAQDTIDRAKDGDPEALKKVGYVVASAAALVGLCVLRRILRSR